MKKIANFFVLFTYPKIYQFKKQIGFFVKHIGGNKLGPCSYVWVISISIITITKEDRFSFKILTIFSSEWKSKNCFRMKGTENVYLNWKGFKKSVTKTNIFVRVNGFAKIFCNFFIYRVYQHFGQLGIWFSVGWYLVTVNELRPATLSNFLLCYCFLSWFCKITCKRIEIITTECFTDLGKLNLAMVVQF